MVDYIILVLCSIVIMCLLYMICGLYLVNKILVDNYNVNLEENASRMSYIKKIIIIGATFLLFTAVIYILTSILNNMMYCVLKGMYCNNHMNMKNKSELYVEIVNKFLLGGIFIYYSVSYVLGMTTMHFITSYKTLKYILETAFTVAIIIGMIYGPINTPMYWLVTYGISANV